MKKSFTLFFAFLSIVANAQWVTRANLTTATAQHAAAAHPNGSIYVFSGYSSSQTLFNTFQIYNTSTNVWSAGPAGPAATRGAASCLGTDNNFYVMGGFDGSNPVATNFRYDPSTNTWATRAAMPITQWEASAASYAGRIYVIGGETNGQALQIYTIGSNSWTTGANLPITLKTHRAVATPSGEIFVFGGRTGGSGGALSSAVYKYVIATNTWTNVATLPAGRNSFGACLGADGNIYIVGGKDNGLNHSGPFYNTTYIFNPVTYTFTTGAVLPASLAENTAVSTSSGIYCMGGTNGASLNSNYFLSVISITTGTITGSPFCSGAAVSVPYTASGTFIAGNIFTAQLSNASGSFASPVNIGTVAATTSGSINAVIPAAPGTGYRIRVVSNTPVVTGTDNGVNLTIDNSPPVITVPANIATVNDPNVCTKVIDYTVSATDNCGLPNTLADVLSRINANQTTLVNTVPSPYPFAMDGGLNGNNISDGGSDMYDGGNYLNTNLGSNITYSDNAIIPSAVFGTGGQYFTRYITNGASGRMFVMAADVNNVSQFFTTGNLGADGSGIADAAQFNVTSNGTVYNVFLKRVYNAFDPSINQAIIIPNNPAASQTYATNTNDGAHTVLGITATTRIYYLLYAGNAGGFIDNVAATAIVQTFLNTTVGYGILSFTQTAGLPSGSAFPMGTTTNTFTAVDGNGNSATNSFTVTVSPGVEIACNGIDENCNGMADDDVVAPVITVPANIVAVAASGSCSQVVSYASATATDNCGSGSFPTGVLANATTGTTLLSPSGSATPMQVAFNPVQNLYYASNGGSPSVLLKTYPGAGGAEQFSNIGNYDFRGLWWNSNLNQLEGNSYNGGYRVVNLDGSGNALGTGTNFTGTQPNSQSMGTYDWISNRVLYFDQGSIHRYNRAGFAFISSSAVTGLPVPTSSISANFIGFSGIVGAEVVLYDWVNRRAYFINAATGAYSGQFSQLPGTAPMNNFFGASVTNGQLFLFDNITNTFKGYNIISSSLIGFSITQTAGLPSGSAFPVGVTTNTFTATDASGNVGTNSFTVTVNSTDVWYQDADNDGYYTATQTACSSPGTGWTTTVPSGGSGDCAPADNTMHAEFPFYTDTDGDGYGAGSSSNQCAVNATTPPTGYSANNTDCAPADATKFASFPFYADTDGDGYGAGSSSNQCAVNATTPPAGYSLNNTDCDDSNPAYYQLSPVSVSISVYNGTSTICAGQPVSFVANPTNGGNAPTYKWYLNGGLVQNGSSASYPNSTIATNDQIYCELTSNSGCAITPTANSNTITMTVISPAAVPATPGTITGPTVVCATNTYSYSIAPVADATQYLWYFPQGTLFVSGQGTTNVTVTYPVNLLNGAVKVEARNCLGISALRVVTLSMLPKPATPGVITGQVKVCPGTYTYSCPVVTNASSYTWTVPANATILSGQGTNSVSIEFAAGYTTGAVKVAASNCKGTSALRTLTVAAYTTLTTPSVITGQSTAVCATTTGLVYSIGAVAGATGYTWTVTGGTIVSGQNTTSLTVDFPASFTTATITVRATNACAQSALRTLSITQKPALPAAITGPAAACASTPNVYSTAAVAGATSYNWTLPAGWNLISGGGTNSITVTAGASGGAVKVAAVNACGTSAFKSTTVTINLGCRTFIPSEAVEETQEQVFLASVYPNPMVEKCTVEFTTPAETEPAFVRLFDVTGKLITEQQITALAGTNRIEVNMQQQASGVYVIQLQQGDKQKHMRVVKQ